MKIAMVAGCRPEFVKLAPVVQELRRRGEFPQILATGQHDSLLRGTPFEDGMKPDVNLNLPSSNDPVRYAGLLGAVLKNNLAQDRPDMVVVQGDTASAYAGAWAASELEISVAHVEAGVRTGDFADPYPEEEFRVWIDAIARWGFAPTKTAGHILAREWREDAVQHFAGITGNPGIDALYSHTKPVEQSQKVDRVLITLHRRESFGEPLYQMTCGVVAVAKRYSRIEFVWPMHPNPKVQQGAGWAFASDGAGVHPPPNLVDVGPMGTVEFAQMLSTSRAVITDSGGVQEEAAALGIPAVIAREKTDRPESVELGLARVAGRTAAGILAGLEWALEAKIEPSYCFGDGHAAERIVTYLLGAK